MGLAGVNDAYMLAILGESAAAITNASTMEERIYNTAILLSYVMEGEEGGLYRYVAESFYNTKIQKIICPKDMMGLITGLPYSDGKQYCYENDPQTTVDFLMGDNVVLILKNN